VNLRFRGYGYEHIEWTRRFLLAGYGGRQRGELQGAGGFVPRPWLDDQERKRFLAPFARWFSPG
jgi:hypothetical protein